MSLSALAAMIFPNTAIILFETLVLCMVSRGLYYFNTLGTIRLYLHGS